MSGPGIPAWSRFATRRRGWLGPGEARVGIDVLAVWHPGVQRTGYRHPGNGVGGELPFYELQQGLAKPFGEAQIVNTFLSGDRTVSVAATQFLFQRRSRHRRHVYGRAWQRSRKILLTDP